MYLCMQKSPSSSEKVFIKCTHTFIALSTLQKSWLRPLWFIPAEPNTNKIASLILFKKMVIIQISGYLVRIKDKIGENLEKLVREK